MHYFPSTRVAIGSDAVDQTGSLLVDSAVVAVKWPGDRGLDGQMAADFPVLRRSEGFIMDTDCD